MLYLLWVHNKTMNRFSKMNRKWKVAATLLIASVLVIVTYGLLERYTFLRFAFVPFGNDQLVLEGYSMFSLSHLADVANLILFLVPSVLVLAAATVAGEWRRAARDPRIRFLAITTASVCVAVFVLEAKIGMPRDWDVFSFVGYPLLALSLMMVLISANRQLASRVTSIAVIIAVLCLAPRVITANIPAQGIEQFRDYAEIDIRKNRTGWYTLHRYYEEQSDSEAFNAVGDLRRQRFPEEGITVLANGAIARAQVDSAIQLLRSAIDLNPTYSGAWANLGYCYTSQRRYDSAASALEIGNALNPGSPGLLAHLGLVYVYSGRDEDAERVFLEAIGYNPDYFEPTIALARLYQNRGEQAKYLWWLDRAVYMDKADGLLATELGDQCLREGKFGKAATAFRRALAKGADSAGISQRMESHPELVQYMTR